LPRMVKNMVYVYYLVPVLIFFIRLSVSTWLTSMDNFVDVRHVKFLFFSSFYAFVDILGLGIWNISTNGAILFFP